jgi:hypothetical protein
MIPEQGTSVRLQALLWSVILMNAAFAAVSPCLLRLDSPDSFGGQNSRSFFVSEPRPV